MEAEQISPTDIDLLLIGKTGYGKSATGNSILRRKAFKSQCNMSSVTKEVQYEVSEFEGRVIKVVDGPGVGDTRLDTAESVELVKTAMEYAIACNPRGYHAFLLVVRLGNRYTGEDLETIAFLKYIFGPDFAKKFCIVVLTCGDNFDSTGQSFEEWCAEQQGDFKDLLRECGERVVLFDNVTRDEHKKQCQLKGLIKMVDTLRLKNHRYSDEHFEKAQGAREHLMVQAKKEMISEEVIAETSLVIQKLQEIQLDEDPESQMGSLEILLTRVESLLDNISIQDKGTGALHDLVQTVKGLHLTVYEELTLCSRLMDERERMAMHEQINRQQLEEEMLKIQEDYATRLSQLSIDEELERDELREQERKRQEAEDKRREEREAWEKRIVEEIEDERRKYREKTARLEKLYREAKAENDKGFFVKLAEYVSWSMASITEWLNRKSIKSA